MLYEKRFNDKLMLSYRFYSEGKHAAINSFSLQVKGTLNSVLFICYVKLLCTHEIYILIFWI